MIITPACPVYGECGGCQYQHLDYADELKEKERLLKEVLQLPDHLFTPIVASPKEYQYRHRIDLARPARREPVPDAVPGGG